MNSNERFKAAYDYLYSIGKVHSIKGFAGTIGAARTSVSKAYNGDPDYVKGALLTKVSAAYPGIFNREWLVDGIGEMLAEQPKVEVKGNSDLTVELIRMCNELMSDVRSLREELLTTKAEVEKLKRAHYGYASVAADGGIGIDEKEFVDVM